MLPIPRIHPSSNSSFIVKIKESSPEFFFAIIYTVSPSFSIFPMNRIGQLTYQMQSLESLRYDLSVRNAELQEKVVRLQDDTEDRIRRVEKDYQEDLDEMEDLLSKARAQLKSQGKAKDREIANLKAAVS